MAEGQFRAAIVGCGRIAGIQDAPRPTGIVVTHAQAYGRHPRFQLVAVSDPQAKRLDAFSRTWSVPHAFTDIGPMLADARPEIVSVCSSTEFHFEHVVDLIQHRWSPRVILVEKPICQTAEQLSSLLELAEQATAAVIVNHTRRFDESHTVIAGLIQRGEFGKITTGRCEYYGGWMNNGSHVVDTLRLLLGSDPEVKSARPGATGRKGDDCLDVVLGFDGGSVFIDSVDESQYQLFEIDLRFDRGRVALRDFGHEISVEDARTNELGERVLKRRPDAPSQGMQNPLVDTLERIARFLATEDDRLISGVGLGEARGTMQVLWQALALADSSALGQDIDIGPRIGSETND